MEKIDKKYVDFSVMAGTYKTRLTKKFSNRPQWNKPEPGDVLSNLPGTIIQIKVKVGEKVEAGQLLLIHEAMKMLNRVVAPVSGIVTDINVNVGDKIGKNHLMIKIVENEK
ncbi:biotin carboxyl carrier protein [Parabacteroides sp. PM6-13]|uniref:acetyl-CoA carboxylase biotin carboxyl carrier protein subunit n=1 Tax=Parabacteroides sp. PM6-13 TaxID=1742408 RepID=UPI002473F48E|nr:acetyl-CoA carboxylase biotin carboxyl carrier protein subunit [Parabacteroides sp. PM6-13]MDH6343564.1 biotin carboxyl carrier protein [Parabacteroides sp. PM6-13]